MSVKVVVTLDAPDGVITTGAYGADAKIQLQRSTVEAFTAPADVTELAVAASTYVYEYWDAAGLVTSWYRWRLEKADDSATGEWSAPFQGIDPAIAALNAGSYASIDDLLLTLPTRPPMATSSDRIARMQRALVSARERLEDEVGLSFFRTPQTGDTTWIIDGPGGDVIHAHDGIAALTAVEVRDSVTGTWTAVDASDWLLEPSVVASGEPYFHVRLTGAVARGTWPRGRQLVRLTGARGFPRMPRKAIDANVAFARQALAADPSFQGGAVGPDQLGNPVGPNRMPDAVWRLKRAYVELFMGCQL